MVIRKGQTIAERLQISDLPIFWSWA